MYQPMQFKNVVVHPGGNTILHWLHCKADEEFRARSVRGCSIRRTGWYYKGNITITGIFNWKSLVKAMRAFRGVSAALLKRFLSTGLKTFEQIEQYLDIACLHPTGRHWVNNFLHILFTKKDHGLIPPTSANPLQYVLRAHLQACYGKRQMSPMISPTLGGLSKIPYPFLPLLRVPLFHQS